jgi:ribosomal protein S19
MVVQSATKTYRNHYGLNCETVIGEYMVHTMRVYGGNIVSSLSITTQRVEGVYTVYRPTNKSINHGKIKRLTSAKLLELHNKSLQDLLK